MKSTIELLCIRFSLAMKDGRVDPKAKHDIIELLPDQKRNIIEYMKAMGKAVTPDELDLCFRYFRKKYWKEHEYPPRVKEKTEATD